MNSGDYLELLRNWTDHAKSYIYIPPDRKELACYGTGGNTWGVQTNQKALAAFGILAASGNEEALDYALRLLRFSLESPYRGFIPVFRQHEVGTYMDKYAWNRTDDARGGRNLRTND